MPSQRRFAMQCRVPAPVEALFAWHARPGALERLIPPFETVRILRSDDNIRDGATVDLRLGSWPALHWTARHEGYVENERFCDVQVSGPFAYWRHTHEFSADPAAPGASILKDQIEYAVPGGALGDALTGGWIQRKLERTFTWRHRRTRIDLTRHECAPIRSLRIVLAGGSGLVGRALRAFLTTGGHEVFSLVRRAPRSGEIAWNPASGTIDSAALEGFDAIIHLGGEGIADRSWTPERKEAIRASRVGSTDLLAQSMARLSRPPRVFLCASAVGFYGDRGDEVLNEESPPGAGFLPDVCRAWETAAEPARRAGIRVVNLRIGIVLTPRGGALAAMLRPVRLGLGGVVGSGRQYLSWIGLDDLLGAIHFALGDARIEGPLNCTAPEPLTNREFTRVLGRVLRRPTILPVPSAAIRTLLGEMGDTLLLRGARVLPQKLSSGGFSFLTPNLDSALRWELGQPGATP